jgi:hypothetical protein
VGSASHAGPLLSTVAGAMSNSCRQAFTCATATEVTHVVNCPLAHRSTIPAGAWCIVASCPNRTLPKGRVELPLVRGALATQNSAIF